MATPLEPGVQELDHGRVYYYYYPGQLIYATAHQQNTTMLSSLNQDCPNQAIYTISIYMGRCLGERCASAAAHTNSAVDF
ncbi:hypothetical protein BD779DRAFT_1567695 [Infundibulicybe gibba]|nr:hypothetical protein BD779DRAFT_1567695 [Infundibulicybe gibba]